MDEIETMAYRNAVPWHNKGTYVADAPTVEEMTRLAGLDWRVQREEIFVREHGGTPPIMVPDHFALVRDTDRKVLGVCGSKFKPVQNAESMEFFREFVDAGAATLETAGSLRGGQIVWALANLNQDYRHTDGDTLKEYVLLSNSHKPGQSLIVKATCVRVVCANTLAMALNSGKAEFRMSHVRKFDSNMRQLAADACGMARDRVAEFQFNMVALKSLEMDAETVQSWVLALVAPGVTGLDDSRVARDIMSSYYTAPGAEPGTGWGALNGVTHYADHVAPTRKGDGSRRLERAWFGDTAQLKQQALDSLLVTIGG
jgi:phage/plasmid-like protein (TIGR03299 family)